MLVPRVFVKDERLTQRLIDDFLANALGAMMNASYLISIAYFGIIKIFHFTVVLSMFEYKELHKHKTTNMTQEFCF